MVWGAAVPMGGHTCPAPRDQTGPHTWDLIGRAPGGFEWGAAGSSKSVEGGSWVPMGGPSKAAPRTKKSLLATGHTGPRWNQPTKTVSVLGA